MLPRYIFLSSEINLSRVLSERESSNCARAEMDASPQPLQSSDALATASAVQSAVNLLRDPDKFKRKRGLASVSMLLDSAQVREPRGVSALVSNARTKSNSSTPAAASPLNTLRLQTGTPFVVELLEGPLFPPLLACLDDVAESNREASIAIFLRVFSAPLTVPAGPAILSQVTRKLAARIGKLPFAEDVEELRLQLVRLLCRLICNPTFRSISDTDSSVLSDAVAVVAASALDPFPEVKIESATALSDLLASTPGVAHRMLDALASPLSVNLSHQRNTVRLAALDALHRLLPLGGESLPRVFADVVLPAVRSLTFDRTAGVRKQLALTAGHWLGSLPLQCRDVSDAPLLVLLAALMADENGDVAELALSSFQTAALSRSATSVPLTTDPDHMSSTTAAAGGASSAPVASGITADLLAAADAATAPATTATSSAISRRPSTVEGSHRRRPRSSAGVTALPFPFRRLNSEVALPRCGSALAQQLQSSTLPLVLRDCRDWTARVRLAAVGALRSLIVLAGDDGLHALDVQSIVDALVHRVQDDEGEIRRLALDTSRVLGALEPADTLFHLVLLPMLGPVTTATTAGRDDDHGNSNREMASAADAELVAPGAELVTPADNRPRPRMLASSPGNTAAILGILAAALSAAHTDDVRPYVPALSLALGSGMALDDAHAVRAELGHALTQVVRHVTLASGYREASLCDAQPDGLLST